MQGSDCKLLRGVTSAGSLGSCVDTFCRACPNMIARNTTGRTCPTESKQFGARR